MPRCRKINYITNVAPACGMAELFPNSSLIFQQTLLGRLEFQCPPPSPPFQGAAEKLGKRGKLARLLPTSLGAQNPFGNSVSENVRGQEKVK